MMGQHIIGTMINGGRARFLEVLSDAQFDALVASVGGDLPRPFFAWHLEDGAWAGNNEKARRVGELPVVCYSYPGSATITAAPFRELPAVAVPVADALRAAVQGGG
jgi:hypothetical protein